MEVKNMVGLLVLALLAAAVSGQDLGEFAPAPAPDTGAGFSLGICGVAICSSLFFSMIALLRN